MLVRKSKYEALKAKLTDREADLKRVIEEREDLRRQLRTAEVKSQKWIDAKSTVEVGKLYKVALPEQFIDRVIVKREGKFYLMALEGNNLTASVVQFDTLYPNGASSLRDVAKYMARRLYLKASDT